MKKILTVGVQEEGGLLPHEVTVFSSVSLISSCLPCLALSWAPVRACNEMRKAGTRLTGTFWAQASRLVAVMGVSSTLGRVVIGRMAVSLPAMTLMQLSMFISGLCVVALALIPPQQVLLAAAAAIFGFFAGSVVALIAPILVDLVGIENLPLAFGLAAAIQSPGVIFCPPIIGGLRDMTDSYFLAFMLPGCLMTASASVIWLIPSGPAAVPPSSLTSGKT